MKQWKSLIGYLLFIVILLSVAVIISGFRHQNVCANTISCTDSLKLAVENDSVGTFYGQKITPPKIDLSAGNSSQNVLGMVAVTGEKHIYVDLAKQTLYAYQGDILVMQTLISSGKWFPTPAGDYQIWIKLRATRMSGGSGPDFYELPNVPFVMFFAGGDVGKSRGFSLHGAYWHNNFGHPMSHGCVNMRIVDAEKLYNWVENQATKVTIYGQAPL